MNEAEDIPIPDVHIEVTGQMLGKETLTSMERRIIVAALRKHAGHIGSAVEQLRGSWFFEDATNA